MKGLVHLAVLLGFLCLLRARQSRSSSADVPSTCDRLRCRDCMTNVCSWASTIHVRSTESPDVCQWCDSIDQCQAKGQAGNTVRNSSAVWRRSSERERDDCSSFGYISSCPTPYKSYSTTLKSGDLPSSTECFYNFLHLHFVRAALKNFVQCDNLNVSDSNGQAHLVDYVSLQFSHEDSDPLPPCTTSTKCNAKSQVVVADHMDGTVFCFAANTTVAPTSEWKNNSSVLELTYKDAMPCCKSNSQTGTPNGNISVVLRLALPSNEKDPEPEPIAINNYDSLLSCNSNSNPLIIDAARYPADVERIQYIDLSDSDFNCTSSDGRQGHNDKAPVASTVGCRFLNIVCMNDSASKDTSSCVDSAAQQYLSVQVTPSGPTEAAAECVDWAKSQSRKPMNLKTNWWHTTAITKELYEKNCRFRFQAVARCPGSKIHQTTSKAVEIPVVFNCSAWEPKCGGQSRGYCNPRTLYCECKETCHKLDVHYRGDNCETDPWCSTDIPWIAIGISSLALIFTVTTTIGCWLWRRGKKQKEQPERQGYGTIRNGDGEE